MAYIDKSRAIGMLERFKKEHSKLPNACLKMIDVALNIIKQTPTADVVEVVRCGKCEHGEKTTEFRTDCTVRCSRFDKTMVDNDFCSYGQRKEGD